MGCAAESSMKLRCRTVHKPALIISSFLIYISHSSFLISHLRTNDFSFKNDFRGYSE